MWSMVVLQVSSKLVKRNSIFRICDFKICVQSQYGAAHCGSFSVESI